jgi:catechol 2,3-dioxygenase-like lactoylglutathione lyase family enzyme
MGHVNLKSPRPSETAKFFTETLNLRLSEFIGSNLYWMRTGTEHHAVALRPGGEGHVHHLGFEVAGWHVYQPMMDHLEGRGYRVEYGPGRHRPGRSLFVYVCDPSSGLRAELFADMVHINDPDTPPIGWEPGDRLTKTLNTWGPTPPESFLA